MVLFALLGAIGVSVLAIERIRVSRIAQVAARRVATQGIVIVQAVQDRRVLTVGGRTGRVELLLHATLAVAGALVAQIQLLRDDQLLALELNVVHELGRGRRLQARGRHSRALAEHVEVGAAAAAAAVGRVVAGRVGAGVALLLVELLGQAGLVQLLAGAARLQLGAVGWGRALLQRGRRARGARAHSIPVGLAVGVGWPPLRSKAGSPGHHAY